jgi:hypothetical protein
MPLARDERLQWAEEFNEGDYSELDTSFLAEYRRKRELGNYRVTRSIELICEYCLHLEQRVSRMDIILREKSELVQKLLSETSEDDGLNIGDI